MDVSREAQIIVRCVAELGQHFGVGVVAETLCGADTEKIRKFHMEREPSYGLLKDLTQVQVRERIRFLLDTGTLQLSSGPYPVVLLGKPLSADTPLLMRVAREESSFAKRRPPEELDDRQSELFSRLRVLRASVARRQGVPAYQRSDILERLESGGEFRSLVAEVERKLGKKLTVPDIGILLGLQDYLGLPGDVIYLLVCHCAERIQRRYGPGRRPAMRQIEKEGYAWARKGIDSQRAAAAYLKQYAQRQETIPLYMRALGLGERAPSPSEEKYLTAWQEMGFAPEAVALAADKTILKCHELKWPYCNGILKRWHEAGLHTPEEIQSGDRPAPGREDKPRESAWKYV